MTTLADDFGNLNLQGKPVTMLMLGEGGVGKSTTARAMLVPKTKLDSQAYIPTGSGAMYPMKATAMIEHEGSTKKQDFQLVLQDTNGQELGSKSMPLVAMEMYPKADGAVVFFDLGSKKTLHNSSAIIRLIHDNIIKKRNATLQDVTRDDKQLKEEDKVTFPMVLVGTKCDGFHQARPQDIKLPEAKGIPYFESGLVGPEGEKTKFIKPGACKGNNHVTEKPEYKIWAPLEEILQKKFGFDKITILSVEPGAIVSLAASA